MKIPRTLLLLLAPFAASAATTINNPNAHAYGANIGWINCRGDVTNGAVIGEFFCSGFIYSANCGWIHLGDGTPTNGVNYTNDSATNFGVNVTGITSNGLNAEAKLRGFAYGANIGWVNFENGGDPRVNLTTGQLQGFAYSANVGWIVLSGTGVMLFTDSIAPGPDSDGDTIPDAWEFFRASSLGPMNIATDSDGDGILDKDEYAADTNPFNANERLQITAIVAPRQVIVSGPIVTDLTWTSRPTRRYQIERSPDLLTAFTLAVGNVVPSGAATTFHQFNDPAADEKYYKVRAKLPLAP